MQLNMNVDMKIENKALTNTTITDAIALNQGKIGNVNEKIIMNMKAMINFVNSYLMPKWIFHLLMNKGIMIQIMMLISIIFITLLVFISSRKL